MRAVEGKQQKGAKVYKGNFFKVSLGSVRLIAKQTKSAEAVLAYIVLSQCKQKEGLASTGGAPVIAESLGITRFKGEKLIAALSTVSWGERPTERAIVSPQDWNEVTEVTEGERFGKFTAKILPPYGDDYLYLDNSFVKAPDERFKTPIARMMEVPQQYRLDAVNLMSEMYHKHHIADFGGVDPNFICTQWKKGSLLDLADYGKGCDDARFFATSERNRSLKISDDLLNGMFMGDAKRFNAVFTYLQRSNIVYEVAVVFSSNILETVESEVLYTLRNCGKDIEGNESEGLARVAVNALESCDLDAELLSGQEVYRRGNKANLYAYAAPTDEAQVVGVFRLQHLTNAKDNKNEHTIELKRNERWKDVYENLANSEDDRQDAYTYEATTS
jgi:hypothetical protein